MSTDKGLYFNFHHLDLTQLKELYQKQLIDSEVVTSLLDYWRSRLSDKGDALYSRYMEYYIFFESVKSLFLSVFIFNESSKQLEHSYGIFPTASGQVLRRLDVADHDDAGELEFEYNARDFRLHYLRQSFQENHYLITIISLKNIDIAENLNRFKSVFQRFYLPSSFERDERLLPMFVETENVILDFIRVPLQEKQPVTFTYFYFESMTKYINFSGDNFAHGLLEELNADVRKHLKHEDRSFILSTREILIVSPRCEKELMEQRFRRVLFQAKSLLLSYQTQYYTIREPIVSLYPHWDNITANLSYRSKIENS